MNNLLKQNKTSEIKITHVRIVYTVCEYVIFGQIYHE